jgi:hypothetical protein
MHIDHSNDPAGETQTFDPRPRPATWVVAVNVNPLGKWVRSFEFLELISKSLNEIAKNTYFSNMVFVLVTTSPYMRNLPNSSALLDFSF